MGRKSTDSVGTQRKSAGSGSSAPRKPRRRRDDPPKDAGTTETPMQSAPSPGPGQEAADIFTEMLRIQAETARQVMTTFLPDAAGHLPNEAAIAEMGKAMLRVGETWPSLTVPATSPDAVAAPGRAEFPTPMLADPVQWMGLMQGWFGSLAAPQSPGRRGLWDEGVSLWENILAQYGLGAGGSEAMRLEPQLPRQDKRFVDPA